jgi:hypothetical protein
VVPHPGSLMPWSQAASLEPYGCNYKPAEKILLTDFFKEKNTVLVEKTS